MVCAFLSMSQRSQTVGFSTGPHWKPEDVEILEGEESSQTAEIEEPAEQFRLRRPFEYPQVSFLFPELLTLEQQMD